MKTRNLLGKNNKIIMLLLGLLIILMLGQNTMIEQMTDGDRYSCTKNPDYEWKGGRRFGCKKNSAGKYDSLSRCEASCHYNTGDK